MRRRCNRSLHLQPAAASPAPKPGEYKSLIIAKWDQST